MAKVRWGVLFSSFLIVIAVAIIGSIFTSNSVNSEWYNSIKPSITPPNFVFPIAWGILFFLIALSLYFAWVKNKNRKIVAWIFGINFGLNILWSIVYFGLQSPSAALAEISLLWLSIIIMIQVTWKVDKKAAWLLVPYLLWVSFAIVLNYLSM